MKRYEMQIEGMGCAMCEERILSALSALQDTEAEKVDHVTGTAVIASDLSEDTLREAIEEAGYDVVSVSVR